MYYAREHEMEGQKMRRERERNGRRESMWGIQ